MSIKQAAGLLRNSRNAVVLTGAGISTPSGIPDFRSNQNGLWNKSDPMEVASLNAFRLRPEKFFSWVRPLVRDILDAKPNPAHFALSRLEEAGYISSIITQNIDGLHQSAGSKTVYEIHGSLDSMTCIGCYRQHRASLFSEPFIIRGEIPICPNCGGALKPDVILFGEQLPVNTWQSSQNAARNCDLMIIAGSSLEVMPVAGLPTEALESKAKLIIINHSPTYMDGRADIILNGDLAEVLPRIADEILQS